MSFCDCTNWPNASAALARSASCGGMNFASAISISFIPPRSNISPTNSAMFLDMSAETPGMGAPEFRTMGKMVTDLRAIEWAESSGRLG